jgi:hypothetical protein
MKCCVLAVAKMLVGQDCFVQAIEVDSKLALLTFGYYRMDFNYVFFENFQCLNIAHTHERRYCRRIGECLAHCMVQNTTVDNYFRCSHLRSHHEGTFES